MSARAASGAAITAATVKRVIAFRVDRFMSACRRNFDLIVRVDHDVYNRVDMPCASVRSFALVVAFLVAVAHGGCGGSDQPCMSMGAMSDVLAQAQLFRLDVYDGNAHCDGQ